MYFPLKIGIFHSYVSLPGSIFRGPLLQIWEFFDRQGSHSDLFTRQNSPHSCNKRFMSCVVCTPNFIWHLKRRFLSKRVPEFLIGEIMKFPIWCILNTCSGYVCCFLCNWRIAQATMLVTHHEFAEPLLTTLVIDRVARCSFVPRHIGLKELTWLGHCGAANQKKGGALDAQRRTETHVNPWINLLFTNENPDTHNLTSVEVLSAEGFGKFFQPTIFSNHIFQPI